VSELSYQDINDTVLDPLDPPRDRRYFISLALLATLVVFAMFCWIYQVKFGMGVTGLSIPVGWAVYITNFVFWIGIGHAGTLISAILFLVRSRWRVAVSRSAEAMTVFAVMTAGLFPLIHLGRLWVVYYLIPYPSQRQLWPDFFSPLVWDVCAVSTYFTVSIIFWYVGLWPDLASARDHVRKARGAGTLKARLYAKFSLGWSGSGRQWWHHGRGYLFFAALATPLVLSVHSVVSWDFAMSMLPGWHTTIFAPYFVAGAIHSGLAMVLTLLIPLRHFLKLHRVIEIKHFDAAAQVMLVTTAIVGFTYMIEPFIAWYSGDTFEWQFTKLRAFGWFAWGYWLLWACNVLAPLAFLFKKMRTNLWSLMIVSILVNVGMWFERLVLITTSESQDFLPHNWYHYFPRWPEFGITIGSFGFFLFWFLAFCKSAPTVAISDVKEDLTEGVDRYFNLEPQAGKAPKDVRKARTGVLGIFPAAEGLYAALTKLRQTSLDCYETYSPVRLREAESLMSRGRSPLRRWTLMGAILGAVSGFSLAIGAASVNQLMVGGKHPVSIVPYCVIGFEGLILFGALANLGGVLGYCGIGIREKPPRWYHPRFTSDRFGLFIACGPEQFQQVQALLASANPEETRVFE
jgi:molybdopterin-containing oxidoreductase family membrane subunit